MPNFISAPGAFAMVGMAGFFAAAARTPVSTIIMVSEMTSNYELLVPSMWVSMLAFLLTAGAPSSLYEKQAACRSDSEPHQGDMIRAVLERLFVRNASRLGPRPVPVCIPESATLSEVMRAFDERAETSLPMADARGNFSGQLVLDAVRQTIAESEADESRVIAADLALPPESLHPDNTLAFALRRMTETGRNELFVLDDNGAVISLFRESDIGALCEQQIEHSIQEGSGDGKAPPRRNG